MSSIVISGDTSGSVTLSAPATAGSNTIVLPSGSGTLTLPTGTATITANGLNSNIVAGTAVASTSGTSIDFTSIPSWVKRITLMFTDVSTTGTSNVQIQLGTGGSPTTTGYASSSSLISGTISNTSNTTGLLTDNASSATANRIGLVTICNITGNTWVSTSNMQFPNLSQQCSFAGGYIALSGTLDMLRITTITGVQTFDAGSINILYE
jgi:hypothetical protein